MQSGFVKGVVPLASALLLVLGPAFAGADDFDRSGVYVGVGGAWGKSFTADFASLVGVPEVDEVVDVKDTGGINARVGYRFFSWVAIEAMYEWMANFDTESKVSSPALGISQGQTIFDVTTHTLTANLKLIVPTWRIQPYLLLGIGGQYRNLDSKIALLDSDSGWAFAGRPGLGVDVYITKNLVANVEATGVFAPKEVKLKNNAGDISDNVYMSVGAGLQYRF